MREDFDYGFDRLVRAFSPTKPDQKAGIYFDELQNVPMEAWSTSVNYILRNESKFPSISTLLTLCRANSHDVRVEKQDCRRCDGFGWVMIGKSAFRGMCIHGDTLSKNIPQASKDHEEKNKELDEFEIANVILKNPERFARGFVQTSKPMKMANPKLYEKVRKVLVELMGKDALVQIVAVEKQKEAEKAELMA